MHATSTVDSLTVPLIPLSPPPLPLLPVLLLFLLPPLSLRRHVSKSTGHGGPSGQPKGASRVRVQMEPDRQAALRQLRAYLDVLGPL